MSNKICLPQTHFIIVICVFMSLCIWYIHNENKNHIKDDILLEIIKKMTPTNTTNTIDPNNSIIDPNNSIIDSNNSIIDSNNSIINSNNSITEPSDFIINSVIEKRLLLSMRDRAILFDDFAPPDNKSIIKYNKIFKDL